MTKKSSKVAAAKYKYANADTFIDYMRTLPGADLRGFGYPIVAQAFRAARETQAGAIVGEDTRKYRYQDWECLEADVGSALNEYLWTARLFWNAAREVTTFVGADGQPAYKYRDWDVFSATLFSNQVREVPLLMRLVWNDARAVIN